MSSVLRSLMVKVGADLTDFDKSLKTMSKNLKNTGKEISNTGAALTKGLTLPILGATVGLGALAIKAGQGADELITMSNKTGIATQTLQELQYAARFVDVEVETMTGSMFKMTQRMADARDGSKAQAEAFKALGIEITNQDGTLRNAKTVWYEAIDALGKVANEADRDALAYELFGRSAQELNPLIKAGSDELSRLGMEAHTVGAVMTDENVTALGKFDDQMQKFQAVLKNAGAELGAKMLPLLEKIMPIVEGSIIPAISRFIDFIGGIIDKFLALDPKMQNFILILGLTVVAIGPVMSIVGNLTTTFGGVIGSIGKAVKVLQGGGGFMSALSALLGPAGLALLAIAAIAAIAFVVIKNWEPISEFFRVLWDKVSGWFVTAKDNIINTMRSAWEAVTGFVGRIIDGVNNAIGAVKNFLGIKAQAESTSFKAPTMPNIPQYAIGTSYVPNDGLAYLHEGEAVIPADKNTVSGQTLQVVFNAPIYGQLDFEQKIKSIVKDAARGGAFRGVFANG